jgi:acyl-CoA dehydrogenase
LCYCKVDLILICVAKLLPIAGEGAPCLICDLEDGSLNSLLNDSDLSSAPSLEFIRHAEAAAEIAGAFADAVDRDARFPAETFDELRRRRLLGMLIPKEFGGAGAKLSDVANVCAILAASCSSSGMVFAMHQVKIACIVHHHGDVPWLLQFLRDAAKHQWLLASSTTEGSGGGDIRSSHAPIEYDDGRVQLIRDASCISYGAYADAIVTTARRGAEAANIEQVLAVFRRQDYTLEPTLTWDTLGMRGTCSVGYLMRAQGEAGQVLPELFERIHTRTMAPYAHLLWSSTWQGVASGAVRRARSFARQASRASGGRMPPGAPHLTKARLALETLRAAIQSALANYEGSFVEHDALDAMSTQLALNLLKVETSELAAAAVLSATRACGLSGYRNDSEFAMGRYLRDILSAPIMINNDRILANAEAGVLMSQPPVWLVS